MVKDDPDINTELVAIQAVCRSQLPNPHVNQVHDFWFQNNEAEYFSRTFIRMEKCTGTLEYYLDNLQQNNKLLCPLELSEIMIHVLTGLSHCHGQGFCHRDLKLSNSNYQILKALSC